jgi:hypothetical protein
MARQDALAAPWHEPSALPPLAVMTTRTPLATGSRMERSEKEAPTEGFNPRSVFGLAWLRRATMLAAATNEVRHAPFYSEACDRLGVDVCGFGRLRAVRVRTGADGRHGWKCGAADGAARLPATPQRPSFGGFADAVRRRLVGPPGCPAQRTGQRRPRGKSGTPAARNPRQPQLTLTAEQRRGTASLPFPRRLDPVRRLASAHEHDDVDPTGHDFHPEATLLHRSPAWVASGRVRPGRAPLTLQGHLSCRSERTPLGAITSRSRSTG